jgi:hypothetical protein
MRRVAAREKRRRGRRDTWPRSGDLVDYARAARRVGTPWGRRPERLSTLTLRWLVAQRDDVRWFAPPGPTQLMAALFLLARSWEGKYVACVNYLRARFGAAFLTQNVLQNGAGARPLPVIKFLSAVVLLRGSGVAVRSWCAAFNIKQYERMIFAHTEAAHYHNSSAAEWLARRCCITPVGE